MLTDVEREKLIAEVAFLAAEVVSFGDMRRDVLPLFTQLANARGTLLFYSDVQCPLVGVGGELAAFLPEYERDYYRIDPLQAACGRVDPTFFVGTRYPEWEAYCRSPVHEFYSARDVKYFLRVRLTQAPHLQPGHAGILLVRSPRQGDFVESDVMLLGRLMPALTAAARRCLRFQREWRSRQALEALLETDTPRPTVVLDRRGQLMWASSDGARILQRCQAGSHKLPEALRTEVLRFEAFTSGKAEQLRPLHANLTSREGDTHVAQLRIVRAADGEPFIVAEFDSENACPAADTARDFGLTLTEAEVLALLAQGLRDQEIAARRGTSLATVRTHVSRILNKLDVRSRTEAALRVRGPHRDV